MLFGDIETLIFKGQLLEKLCGLFLSSNVSIGFEN